VFFTLFSVVLHLLLTLVAWHVAVNVSSAISSSLSLVFWLVLVVPGGCFSGGIVIVFAGVLVVSAAVGNLCHSGIGSFRFWVVFVGFRSFWLVLLFASCCHAHSIGHLGFEVCLNCQGGCGFGHFWLHHGRRCCYGMVTIGCTLFPIVVLSTSFSFISLWESNSFWLW